MKNLLAVVLIGLFGAIAACIDDADSHSGISAAEFDAYVAATESRIAALEANPPGDKVFAGDGSGAAGLAKAASADGKPLGTAVGFLPVDVPVHRSTQFSIKSPNGYLYSVPNDNLNANGVVGIGIVGPVYYASSDCTGTPHVPGTQMSDYGAQQGLVFRIGAGEFGEVVDDPAQYFYVAAGTLRIESFDYQSSRTTTFSCTAEAGTWFAAFPAAQNDPTVTGVDSAPIKIPVGLV